jgi:copper chaperone CopZ
VRPALRYALYLALRYAIYQMKSIDSLSVFVPYAASLLLYSFLKKSVDLELFLMISTVIFLYFIALVVIGLMEEGKDVNIPIAVSKGEVSLRELEKAMENAKHKPTRISYGRLWLRAEGLREERTVIKYFTVNWSVFDAVKREFEFFRELFGANNVRFHIYIPQDQPTSVAFMVGMALGIINHKEFLVYCEERPESSVIVLPSMCQEEGDLKLRVELGVVEESGLRINELSNKIKEMLDKIKGMGSPIDVPMSVLIDLTPSPANLDALKKVSGGKYVYISLEEKRVLKPGEIKFLSEKFVPEVARLISELSKNSGEKLFITLKAPHPVNIRLGFELRYLRGSIKLLHYDREKGEYVELKEA